MLSCVMLLSILLSMNDALNLGLQPGASTAKAGRVQC